MTEQTPEGTQPPTPDPAPEPDTTEDDGLQPAPEDAAEATAKGYAVYDRTTGQYVPGISDSKPTAKQAKAKVPEGHTAAVVRV
jgi:hypothetical protein